MCGHNTSSLNCRSIKMKTSTLCSKRMRNKPATYKFSKHMTMKEYLRNLLTAIAFIGMTPSAMSTNINDNYDKWFCDSTLRVDYIFTGNAKNQRISLDELRSASGWYGRRVNLNKPALRGNGTIKMTDESTGEVIYCTSFSTLFQEWQTTEEAVSNWKSFENIFQLPMPRKNAWVEVILFDTHNNVSSSYKHLVKPNDILIRPIPSTHPAANRILHQGGDSKKCIDIAIVAEGYTAEEQAVFYEDAEKACREILKYAPFSAHKNDFNFTAVALESRESGVSIPHDNLWKETALAASFDTFYSQRYLTTLRLKTLHDALAGIPYEHIIILANTDNYGGGGIYNSYTLSAAHHPLCLPVTVHEFGHSFGGLADEYYYDDQYEQFYFPGIEPWEQNITTLTAFEDKWQDMLPEGTPVPTSADGLDANDMEHIGVYEGGGYQSKGVFRAFMNCRMKTNDTESFCSVCERAIERVIEHHLKPLD